MSSPIGKLYILSRGTTVLGLNLSGFQDLLSSLSNKELEDKIGKSSKIFGITDKLADYFDGDLKAINSIAVKQPGGRFLSSCVGFYAQNQSWHCRVIC